MEEEAERPQPQRGAPENSSLALLRANQELRLELASKEKEEEFKRVVQAMAEAQDLERERLCLEVHDGVTQTLVSAFQYLQALRRALEEDPTPSGISQARSLATRASTLVRQAIQEARDVIDRLEPATLADLGLAATLRQKLREMEAETGCRVEFKSDTLRLPRATELALYRILYEAITNVKRHAHSPRLEVELRRSPTGIKIRVKDWGVGFQPHPTPLSPQGGIGLFSMRKRAELLGGTCQVLSALGQGTTITVEVPLKE